MDSVEKLEVIRLVDDFHYKVDLGKMILFKEDIIFHYEKEALENLNRSSVEYLKDLSHLFDKYLLHIIEEVSEFSEEVEKDPTSEDALYELIDIIGYLCSTTFLIKSEGEYSIINDKRIYDVESKHSIIKDTVYKMVYFEAEEDIEKAINNILIKDCINKLISARRLFDERKWHKNIKRKLSIHSLDNLFKLLEEYLEEVLLNMIELFMALTDSDYKKFNEMYIGKGTKVVKNLET